MKYIKKILKVLLPKLHIKPIILFESYPDLSGNTFMVFEELKKRGYDKKYKLVWQLFSKNCENTKYLKSDSTSYYYLFYTNILEHLVSVYYRYCADILICNNVFFNKVSEKQKYFYLAHGVALKKCGYRYHLPDSANNAKVLTISDYIKKYDSITLHCKEENILPFGFPRNDLLFKENIDMNSLFPNRSFKSVIYWMPTFRQNSSGESFSNISVPIIHNAEICEQINKAAEDNNALIVLKPHPAQDLALVNEYDYSNFLVITDEFFKEKKVNDYEFLGSCDALITDYSSVYYDFLLCDKPIGLCWEDFDEYNENEGFIVDVNYIMSGGEKLYTPDDFCDFIKRVSLGEDMLKSEREAIKNVVHKYCDSNSTKRVVDYIEKEFLN